MLHYKVELRIQYRILTTTALAIHNRIQNLDLDFLSVYFSFYIYKKKHSRCPDVRIQFDHLESELIFQESEGETEEFSVATPPE